MFKSVKILEKVDSTNSYLFEHIHELNLPTIVFSREQRAGKGRIGNKWLSSNKGIFTSIALNIQDYKFELFHYPYLMPLIIHAFLNDFQINSNIKWPNDLLVDKKKISGILIESKENHLVIGIGINVNETREDFKNLDLKATSMFIEKHQALLIEDLYTHFIQKFSELFTHYENCAENILFDWKSKCIHQNELIRCRVGTKILFGDFHGIGPRGELLLKNKNELIKVWAGDIIES